MKASPANTEDTKWVFWKKGACSHTLFYILNQEFGNNSEPEERASDPLAGGLLMQGRQCGMLWGATMAAGAEAYRRYADSGKAVYLAMKASQSIVDSFVRRAHTMDCAEITETDFTQKWSLWKYLLTGKPVRCFRLADQWAPEAIESTQKGLSDGADAPPEQAVSCAAETAKALGADEKQAVMAAGLAGGIGLSGNACGALAAAVWMKSMQWAAENPGKEVFNNPAAGKVLENFKAFTGGELLCSKLCGRHFQTIEAHTEFVRNGGCSGLINALAHGGN